jgi:hypothetical protein
LLLEPGTREIVGRGVLGLAACVTPPRGLPEGGAASDAANRGLDGELSRARRVDGAKIPRPIEGFGDLLERTNAIVRV